MKKFILVVLMLTATLAVKAQDKIGHISSQTIVALMPAAKTAETQIQEFGKQKDIQLSALKAEYERKVKDYQEKLPEMTSIVRESREKEIVQLEGKMNDYFQKAQKEIEEKKFALLRPVLEKVQAAVDKVAAANGFTYIIDMDNAIGLVVYKDESRDITNKVKTELGL